MIGLSGAQMVSPVNVFLRPTIAADRPAAEGGSESTHTVAIRDEDLDRLAAGATDPTDLVRRSFAFLLEREPKEAILRSFDLPIIGRFFPEYEATIRQPASRED